MKLITHLHLVPRLGMSGAVPLLPVYAFMTWTRKLTVHHKYKVCDDDI